MFKNSVLELQTPLCNFTIEDERGNKIVFDIIPNLQKTHEVYIDNDPPQIITAVNFFDCRIRISTENLKLNAPYFIKSTKSLIYRGSDERLYTYGLTMEDKTLSISFPDWNEAEKYHSAEEWEYIRKNNIQIKLEKNNIENIDSTLPHFFRNRFSLFTA